MPHQGLIGSFPLDFTKLVGKYNRRDHDDKEFNDASDVGGFPFAQGFSIRGVQKIELFSIGACACGPDVIDGLKVTYRMIGRLPPVEVCHGIVPAPGIDVRNVGTVEIDENSILVGASGQNKNLPSNADKDGRISTIAFYVYDRLTGLTDRKGPYGSRENVEVSWGSFGPIIAFQGIAAARGLASLGFAKTQDASEYGIAGN